MGRNVVGDEAVEGAVDAIAATGRAVEVGILIGRLGGEKGASRDVILGIVPSPVKEDGSDPAILVQSSRSASKSKSVAPGSLSIDAEWVAEHARQVSRMLLGGMMVIGIYCVAPEAVFKQSTAIICQVLKAIGDATYSRVSSERLVLHIATSPRRLSCRSCSVDGKSSFVLNPCEWKLGKIAANLQVYACTYTFDVSIPVPQANKGDTLKDEILSWAASEMKNIQSAEILIDNSMAQLEESISSVAAIHEVQLLCPINENVHVKENAKNIMGTIDVKGAVCARAYGFPREPLSLSIAYVKEDILASFSNRIELLCEEQQLTTHEEQSTNTSSEEHVSKNISPSLLTTCGKERMAFVLPKRVLLPWNGLHVCDYMLPTESVKDVEERFRDLFRKEFDVSSICNLEEIYIPPPEVTEKPKEHTKHTKHSESRMSLIIALFVTLFAILVTVVVKTRV